jgi:hypothetical protein
MMVTFLSSYKRKDGDNEAGLRKDNEASSKREMVCQKMQCKILSFGFTYIDVHGEERPRCLLCMNILVADSTKVNKLNRDLETMHAKCVRRILEFFPQKTK